MTDKSFTGRLFGPDLPGAGCHATGSWGADGSLHVSVQEPELELIAHALSIDAAGFNAAGVRISWQEETWKWVIFIGEEAELESCAATAPPEHAPLLSRAAGKRIQVERRFRLGWGVLLLFLALPLVGIVAFLWHSDTVADWVVARIPHEQEAKLGNLVLAQTRVQMKLQESGPAVEAIGSIGAKLVKGSPHRYRWFVADRPDINAFAAPGGVVVVFAGLIKAAGSPEEIAGVLAHEVAHAELRHSLRTMVKSLGLRALVSLLLGDVSGTVFTDAATRLTELRFSREAEHEADQDGLQRLIAARIDPNGAIRFYEKLARDTKVAPPPFLSTHPATEDRLARLRVQVAGLKEKWEPLRIDLAAVKEGLR